MKLMNRNLQTVYYCLYEGTTEVKDENGFKTGEKIEKYSDPTEMRCSISAATGYAQTEMFGNLDNYDRVMIVDDMDCPIDVDSVLYVDKLPETDDDGKPIPDYKVKRVAKSLNNISYVISKVLVS